MKTDFEGQHRESPPPPATRKSNSPAFFAADAGLLRPFTERRSRYSRQKIAWPLLPVMPVYDVLEKKKVAGGLSKPRRSFGHSYIICPWIDEETTRPKAGGWKGALPNSSTKPAESQREKPASSSATTITPSNFKPAESLGGKLPYDFLLAETDPQNSSPWSSISAGSSVRWERTPLTYFDKYPRPFPPRPRKRLDQGTPTPRTPTRAPPAPR